jgi:hypothetical protein
MPRVGGLVHGIKVEGCLELGLATGQEHDAGHGWGYSAVEHLQRVVCHLHFCASFTHARHAYQTFDT